MITTVQHNDELLAFAVGNVYTNHPMETDVSEFSVDWSQVDNMDRPSNVPLYVDDNDAIISILRDDDYPKAAQEYESLAMLGDVAPYQAYSVIKTYAGAKQADSMAKLFNGIK